ncbi:MAG: DUF3276 family protein [Treponema sp.]|nr:DUF3276 family protein [Treponema sp.]
MGVRGELFTTQVNLDNRNYFFNVKENRAGDVFLQVVESKNKSGENFDRHAIVIFAEDMQKFFQGLESSLAFIEKDRKERKKAEAEKKAKKETTKKRIYRKKDDNKSTSDGLKRSGRVHIVSKRTTEE